MPGTNTATPPTDLTDNALLDEAVALKTRAAPLDRPELDRLCALEIEVGRRDLGRTLHGRTEDTAIAARSGRR